MHLRGCKGLVQVKQLQWDGRQFAEDWRKHCRLQRWQGRLKVRWDERQGLLLHRQLRVELDRSGNVVEVDIEQGAIKKGPPVLWKGLQLLCLVALLYTHSTTCLPVSTTCRATLGVSARAAT